MLQQAFALTLLPTAASAAPDKQLSPKEVANIQDKVNALYKCSFEETEKLMFSEVGWGDADIKVLSQALSQTRHHRGEIL